MTSDKTVHSDKTNYEDRLPTWQKWTNAFLENWIFAFIVAMVIRQFFLEPFSIPSASMEPMLLGSQIMSKSDHVVVNKLTLRFSKSQRWDVTVFEFPIPEFMGKSGHEHQIFFDEPGEPQSHWLSRPLLHRNFVKRLVVKPGDTFYVSAGDLYVKDANGGEGFDIPQKERVLQDVLWQTMYEHGIAEEYLPWSKGARLDDGMLCIEPKPERSILFTQPLSNLYMKEWKYNVVPRDRPFARPAQVLLSMRKPLFHYQGKLANAWDLHKWSINRLSAKDLDQESYGSNLNQHMDEYVGDLRVVFTCEKITGNPELHIIDRDGRSYRLKLGAHSWSLDRKEIDGSVVQIAADNGNDAELLNKELALCRLDNRVWFECDGVPLHKALRVSPCMNVDASCRIQWAGAGRIELSHCRVERDVHYCRSGFLDDLNAKESHARKRYRSIKNMGDREQKGVYLRRNIKEWTPGSSGTESPEDRFKEYAQVVLRSAESVYSGAVTSKKRQVLIRKRLLGRPCEAHELTQPIGDSPENALTAPDNAYLLFGDNSPFSWDSRNWGWVPGTNIRGRAAWVVFPYSRWKSIR